LYDKISGRVLERLLRQLGGSIATILLVGVLAAAAGAQISPGPLSKAHANLNGATQCAKCHKVGSSALKCLDCHREIATRLDTRRGYHAANAGQECIRCHTEHKGADGPLVRLDRKAFDHQKTGYALAGKHAGVECSKCHNAKHVGEAERRTIVVKDLNRTFLGLSQTCATCHEDKHRKQFASDCAACHTFSGWKGELRFNHANAKYALTGAHEKVTCQKCHPTDAATQVVSYVGVKFDTCSACHKDIHRGSFTKPCQSCHTTANWKQVQVAGNYDHNRAKYKLAGKHVAVRCSQCHQAGNFKKRLLYKQCADCHRPDPHNGQFRQRAGGGIECASCHTVDGFKQAKYDVRAHGRSGYPLEGRHAAVPCAKCHLPQGKATRYKIAFARCTDCHKDLHQEQFVASAGGNRCDGCHTLKGFRPATFNLARHAKTRFALSGGHRAVACDDCHKPAIASQPATVRYRFEDRSCVSCHEDIHRGQFKVRMAEMRAGCELCHTTAEWKQLSRFDHAKTAFALAGAHRGTPCSSCHKPPNLEKTLKNVDFRAAAKRCEECHEEIHGGQFAVRGKNTGCADCHNAAKWKPSVFNHDTRTPFALKGAHKDVRCAACHKEVREARGKKVLYYKPTPTKCAECHRITTAATPAGKKSNK
jgi:hypothetical protein